MMANRNRPFNNGTVQRVASLVLLFSFVAMTASAAPELSLTMKTAAVVDRDMVRLSDIADLTGDAPELIKTLGETVVSNAPEPGQTRFVGIEYVRIRLRQAGYDTDAIAIQGASDVRISRQSEALPAEQIEAAVVAAIRGHMPWKDETVTITDISFDKDIQLPTGKLTYQVVPKRNEDYLGSTIVALHLFVDGAPYRRLWVNATISVMTDVVVVVKPLGKHQHIQLEDLSVVSRELTDLPSDIVRRPEAALGNRATRMIYPNTVLQASMFDAPPVVDRGDIVKIVANAGPMTITATGMVKQQGCLGEMVRVMNTESKRTVIARVTGPGAVQVDF